MPSRLRPALVACVAVVLLLLGSTTAYAAWSLSSTAGAGTVARGTFVGQVSWPVPLNLAGMYPGETRTGVFQVGRDVSTNGRWVYTLGTPTKVTVGPATASTALAGQLTITVYAGATCSGTTAAVGTPSPVLALGATAQHCITVRLAPTAPGTVQGGVVDVTVPVTFQNRPSN